MARKRSGALGKEVILERHLMAKLGGFFGTGNVQIEPVINGFTIDAMVEDEDGKNKYLIDLLYFRDPGSIRQRLVHSRERLVRFMNELQEKSNSSAKTPQAVTVCVVNDADEYEESEIVTRFMLARKEINQSIKRDGQTGMTALRESTFVSMTPERFAQELERASKRL
jgi:hypothetical protein